jgi:hypothetical protein
MFFVLDGFRSQEADVAAVDRHDDRIWNCGVVRFPAKSPPLRRDLDSGKILVVIPIVRGRRAAGDQWARRSSYGKSGLRH